MRHLRLLTLGIVGLLTLGVVGLLVDRVFRWLLARSMHRYMQQHYEV